MTCKHCGADVGSEYRLCPYCGSEIDYPATKQAPENVTINHIVNNNMGGAGFTNNAQPSYQQQTLAQHSSKNKTVALILCILLGVLGAHCFYAGKTGTGILYLFTCGLFGIGWIIDIIRIATGTYKDSRGLPIK